MEAMVKYFNKFGSKPCCYGDLRSYVDAVSVDNRKTVRVHCNTRDFFN